MKGKTGTRYSEEQIIRILEQVNKGVKIDGVFREHGFSEPTFHRWKKRYGGLTQNELAKVKSFSEKAPLKRRLGERALKIDTLKEVLSKKWWGPTEAVLSLLNPLFWAWNKRIHKNSVGTCHIREKVRQTDHSLPVF
jgi:putative transposase